MDDPKSLSSVADEAVPRDAADNVAAILEFIVQATCWTAPGNSVELSAKAVTGLANILMVCQDTLEQAINRK